MRIKRTYGFAIVGCGVIGPIHADAISELSNGRLVVTHDTDAERARELAEAHGADWDVDLDRVLRRPDVDIVCVCVPSGRHAEIGVRAARAGKHVICEKPIEVRLEPADRLIATCRDANVRLGVVFQLRYVPALVQLRSLLKAGSLGRPLSAEVVLPSYRSQSYYDSADWRGTWELDGGGCLMNQGIHFVDILEWLLGPAERVFGQCTTTTHDIEVEDVAAATFTFQSGAIGVVHATTAAPPGLPWRIRVTGTKGTVQIEDSRITSCALTDGGPTLGVSEDAGRSRSSRSDPASMLHVGHRNQFADYLRAVSAGTGPAIGGAAGRRALELVLAVYRSARTAQEVDVSIHSAARTAVSSPITDG